MAKMYPVAGCKFYIGSAAIDDQDDDFVAADFDAVTWIEVKGWVTMGASGDSATLVTSDQIGNKRTKKAKGTRNAGSMENTFDVVADDPGQLAMIAAEQTDDNYPFRTVYNDAPTTGPAPTPSESLFIGLVMSKSRAGGGANDPRRMNSTVEINSNIVHVAAATGA
ncbi:hypothetical protein KUG85_04720 [Nitratireductor sp. L1-7-SE]|uniref:Uncharacterized protein n=1 Tax=Nitratireductor rhodophyticola TaxID=2854036 RepID=A0ABS7RD23_9HYPH|nr:hypothetical protein [Nitratireductor rhodophyticola]MBY8918824.1 hypothetical protein [Nitratireductor rhodophyticola]MBY8919993.1 hypothetical protein [Nitratireductor rhodophyticola]